MSDLNADPTPDPSTPPRSARGGPLRSLALYTRGLMLDQSLRHWTMFYVVIADMLMVFVGDVFLDQWLDYHQHLARFMVYWLIVGWLTILLVLLSIYDLIRMRVQHRILRRQLREKMLGKHFDPDDHQE